MYRTIVSSVGATLALALTTALCTQPPASEKAPTTLRIVRATKIVDGDLSDWDFRTGVDWQADERRTARAALAYDDKFLYAAFHVKDSTPWKNNGSDEQVMFLYGDSIDLQLGLDPKANPARVRPVAGDIRIAIAPQEGKPTVMLYQPIVPGFTGEKVAFTSPVGRVEMDRVEKLTEARVAVKVAADHYVVEAAIPLRSLGFPWPKGAAIRGDVGALYSDEPGSKCLLRLYWANKDTNITADLPSEARLQPNAWGRIQVE